jgi:hypothetical protein
MLILIMFCAAQLVLGLAICGGLRVARRQPNLAGRLAAVTEIRHRPTRLDAARREIVWARGEIQIVDEQLERARRRLSELIPLPESSASVAWFAVLTWILYEGESGVALLLNLASRFANMSDAVAAFVSPFIAMALFAALHVILGSVIQIRAEYRPQRVLHRAKVGAIVGGAGVLLAAWMVLSGRSFTNPQTIESIASLGSPHAGASALRRRSVRFARRDHVERRARRGTARRTSPEAQDRSRATYRDGAA